MRLFQRVVFLVNEWCGKLFRFVIPAIAVIFLIEVISRYGFNSPTLWGPETSEMLFGFVVFMSGGYILLVDQHTRVDVIYRRLSLRQRAILDSFIALLFFFFVLMYLRGAVPYALRATSIRVTSGSVWNPPYWPYEWTLVVGYCLLLLQGISSFMRSVVYAILGRGQVP